MIVAALILAGTLATLGVAWHLVTRATQVRSKIRSRLIVTLKSGAAFEGVLHSADREAWVLRSAQAFGAGEHGAHVPVDGEVLILVAEIDYAQRP